MTLTSYPRGTDNTLMASLRCVAALALLAIAACGSDRGSSPPSASLAVTTISNRTLTRALGGEPATLDPRLAEDNAALALLQDLYEGLTAEAADGGIIPGAAQSWSVSEDGRTWTFRLRENLRWSDGTPLSAAQFVAGLDAARVGRLAGTLFRPAAPRSLPSVQLIPGPSCSRWRAPCPTFLPCWRCRSPRRNDAWVSWLRHQSSATALTGCSLRRPGEKIELERNPSLSLRGFSGDRTRDVLDT